MKSQSTISRLIRAAAVCAVMTAGFALSLGAQTGIQFDGSNDYVTFGAATSSLGVQTFTLEAWIYRGPGGVTMSTGTNGFDGGGGRPNGAYPVLTKGMGEGESPKNINTNFFLGITVTGFIGADFEDSTNGGNHPVWGVTAVPVGEWHHIAATYDGRVWNLYLDGVLDRTLDLGATYIPEWRSIQHAALAIGLNSTGGLATGRFSGVIDEPRVWNVARTQLQIQADLDSSVTAGSGLLGRWGLNEGSGTTAANSVGGSPAGTLTNGPIWVDGAPALAPPAVPPAAPTALAAAAPSAYQVNLSWNDNSDNETAFQVWRSTDGGSNFTLYTSTAADATSYQDTMVNSSAAYLYRVRASNSAGASDYTNDAGVTTGTEGAIALQLGSANAYVTFGPATGTLGAQSLTLECWFKRTGSGAFTTTGTDGILAYPLITKGMAEADGSTSDMNYFLGINSTVSAAGRSYGPPNVLVADFEEGTGTTTPGLNHPVAGVTPIVNDTWYHAAATFDASARRWQLFLNGVLEKDTVLAAGTRFPQQNSIQHAALGTALQASGAPGSSAGYGPGYFDGVIDEARIWNYARTGSEIAGAINSQIITGQTGLLGRWGLNDGGGTTIHGNAGAFVNGTITGSGYSWGAGAPFDILFEPPASPSALAVTPVSSSELGLTWTDNAANETGFEIERSTTGSGGPFSFLTLTGANAEVYPDAGLDAGTEYCYRIRAVNGNGPSGYDGPVCATTTMSLGNGLSLGSANAYVTFGLGNHLATPAYTIETWFRRDGAGVTIETGTGGIPDILPLISKGAAESENAALDINYFLGIRNSDSVICADFEEGALGSSPSLNHPVAGVTHIMRNTWYHAAATYDGSTWNLYLNGDLEATLAVGQPTGSATNSPTAFGTSIRSNGTTSQGYFNGTMDEIRIWNYARPQSEIQSSINARLTTPQPGLIGRWGLDETSGTTVHAGAGTTYDGTVSGSGYGWVEGAPFNLAFNPAPDPPTLVGPGHGATGMGLSPTLEVGVSDPESEPMDVAFYGRPTGTGEDFAIAVLPDAQFYTSQTNGGTNAMFKQQTQWIADNLAGRSIAYVGQAGDLSNDGDNAILEWRRADTTLAILESAGSGIPYGIAIGNHDQMGGTTFYNQFFGEARFSGRPYYGGHYGTNNNNNYQLFTGGGMDFITICLEYSPSAAALHWADGLLKTYGTRRAIVINHDVIGTGNPGSWSGTGQVLYDSLKDNPNLFLILCGHTAGEGRRSDTYNGNTVHTLLADYQSRTNGGSGWMRLLEFSPAGNVIHVRTYSPTLNQWETDGDSQFDLAYDMEGTSYQLIGTNTGVASGSGTSIVWPGLSFGTTYQWYAAADDGHGTTTSPAWEFTTLPPPPMHLIAATGVGHGTVTPSGAVMAIEGADTTFLFEPDPGSWIDSVIVDDVFEGTMPSYTFTNVTTPHTLRVVFATTGYPVTASAFGGGSITPSGIVQVDSAADQAFSIAANGGYHIDSVVVDNVNYGVRAAYAFTDVSGPHAIGAWFSANDSYAAAYPSTMILQTTAITAETGEKPQSKIWTHDGLWWSVLSSSAGTHIYRLDGSGWTRLLQLSAATDIHADIRPAGDVVHVLLLGGGGTELASAEYVPPSHTWQAWTARPGNTAITLDGGVETATIDIDSHGRMWLASDAVTDIVVRWSDSPYSAWSAPIVLATGVNSDDISCVRALPTGQVGVLWSDQNTQRFGFRVHTDGADPAAWAANEIPAAHSAQSVGAGMADDHLNMAVGSDGTIYAAVKTGYDTPGYPRVALLVRHPWGAWDDLYTVDEAGTRGVAMLNEPEGTITVVYTSAEGYYPIVYRRSALHPIAFGAQKTLLGGSYNNVSTMKQNDVADVVYLASSATVAAGVLASTEAPDLVGHWAMEDPSGTAVYDSSAAHNNGTTTGTPTRVPGMKGQALRLNGSSQYATVPNSASLNITGQITLAAWIRPEVQKTQALIHKAAFSAFDGYELTLSSDQRVYVRFNQVTSPRILYSVGLYPHDGTTWMHVAATYDGATIKLYINGVLDNSLAAAFTINPNSLNLGLGAQTTGPLGLYGGSIDEARVYGRALDAGEILFLASHAITASAGPNGSIDPAGTVMVGHGASRSFTVTPDGGFRIDSIIVDGAFAGVSSPYTFTGVSADHAIRAVFEPVSSVTHTITATAGANGSIVPSGAVTVAEGTDQAFAIAPAGDYHIDSVIVDGAKVDSTTSYTFHDVTTDHTIRTVYAINTIHATVGTIPSGRSVIVDGVPYTSPHVFTWAIGSSHEIATDGIQPGAAGIRYVWQSWSDGGAIGHVIAPTGDSVFTATFTTQYLLAMEAGPHGSVSPTDAWYDAGHPVSISATADPDYHFASWTGTGDGSYSGTANPAQVSMNGPVTESASFAIDQVEITIGTDPTGVAFTYDGETYTATQVRTVDVGSSHTVGTTTPQAGAAGVRYNWTSWSDAGAITHTIVPASNGSYIAAFGAEYYLTMIAGSGGTVSPPDGWYGAGAPVEISATPSPGTSFGGWNGSGSGSYSGTNNPASITMNGPITQTASFAVVPVSVDVLTYPPGLTITVDGVPYTTPQTFHWSHGSSHTLAAATQAGGTGIRYPWDDWSDGGAASHSVTPASDTAFTAGFNTQYALLLAADAGGTVAAQPAGPDGWYDAGADVQIGATPGAGYHFTAWRGSGAGSYSGTDNPAAVMMNGPVFDTAGFALKAYTLTVHAVNGTVTRLPDLASYDTGATVQLTPVPSAGYHFTGWTGGVPPGHDADDPLTLTMNGDIDITALFALNQYTLTLAGLHGTVQKNPDQPTYSHGSSVELTAVPEAGYHFTAWSGDLSGSLNPATIVMSGHRSVTAAFGMNEYTITAEAGAHGQISPAGAVPVSHGAAQAFSFLPEAGYHVDSTLVDGSNVPDSATGYTFVNVASNHTIRVTFALTTGTTEAAVARGWNLLSLPLEVFGDPAVYQGALTPAYCYEQEQGYVVDDTLEFGCAYWLKFPADAVIPITGVSRQGNAVSVEPGWNMIGAVSVPVPVASITSAPPGMGTSHFYAYAAGYTSVDTLMPGTGYWVKVSERGALLLNGSPQEAAAAAAIRVSEIPEEPPQPPGRLVPGEVPEKFLLEQAYPNPFNPSTTIRYALPVRSSVSLVIYNAIGERVVSLVYEVQDEGYRSIEWNAAGLPSGVYYYRLSAASAEHPGGDYTSVRRVMLIR